MSNTSRLAVIAIMPLALMLFVSRASAAQPNEARSDELRFEVEGILRDMLDQRSRLTSGVFRVNGEKFNSADPKVPEVKGPLAAFVAFDHRQGLLRLDSEQPMYITSIPSKAPEKATSGVERPVVRWIRTPEFCADWSKSTKNSFHYLHVRKPQSRLEGNGLSAVIDVREAGLIHYMGLETSLGFEKTIEQLLQFEALEVRKENDGKRTLVLRVFGEARFEIQVDPSRGMTATRILVVEPEVTFPGRDYVANVEWEQRNDVWVPQKYRIEFQVGDEYRDHRYYDLSFNWESVNQPVDNALFDYQKLEGIPDGTEIVDTRVDPQKVIGRYGPERKHEPLVKPPVVNNTMRWLLLANVVLLLLVLSYYWLKRRRQIGA